MNKSKLITFKSITLCFLLAVNHMVGQSQKKTYNETFNVDENTVLTINTSHTDIEFDTWNKKQVVVEAVIELEGATEEEAARYFEDNPIKILGNNTEIEISTRNANSWVTQIPGVPGYTDDMVIAIPDIEPFFMDIQIPDLPDVPMVVEIPPIPPIPPLPQTNFGDFDYEEYQERGEAYLEEWSEQFQEAFDEDWQEQMQEWGERYKANMEEHEKLREEHRKEREAIREEQLKEREEMRKEMEEMREEAREERERAREEQRMAREEAREVRRTVIRATDIDVDVDPKIYYYPSDGESKKYKVKRRIKIKMPKSVKLNMNVRHGEVKLAENTRDMKATLSYARLLASTIDGEDTNIVAAYSPVVVQNWNLGTLNTSYSGEIDLKDVRYLVLDATSSNVTIDRLLKSAKVQNNLGALYINSISPDFTEMEISVQNGEVECELPATPYKIIAKGSYSTFSFPDKVTLNKTQGGSQSVHEGYHLNQNSNKSIVINSRYSTVNLEK